MVLTDVWPRVSEFANAVDRTKMTLPLGPFSRSIQARRFVAGCTKLSRGAP